MIQIYGNYEANREVYDAHPEAIERKVRCEMVIKFAEEMQKNDALKIEKHENPHNGNINYYVAGYVITKEDFLELKAILNELKKEEFGLAERLEKVINNK